MVSKLHSFKESIIPFFERTIIPESSELGYIDKSIFIVSNNILSKI